MKNTGAVIAVLGFVLWLGGELASFANLIRLAGFTGFIIGTVLYFVGRKKRER